MPFIVSLFSFLPVSSKAHRHTHVFGGFLFSVSAPFFTAHDGVECDTHQGHKVADVGSLSGIPERNMFTAGQRVQVCSPCQELSGGERQSHRLFWLTQGEYEKPLPSSSINLLCFSFSTCKDGFPVVLCSLTGVLIQNVPLSSVELYNFYLFRFYLSLKK